jgi:hypothetical protein
VMLWGRQAVVQRCWGDWRQGGQGIMYVLWRHAGSELGEARTTQRMGESVRAGPALQEIERQRNSVEVAMWD